jgi:hypothetical protein
MKIIIRELIRCAALIYLLGAPWAIVSSQVEGLGVVLLLAGILPAGSFLFGALKRELDVRFPTQPAPSKAPQLRLLPGGASFTRGDPDRRLRAPELPTDWPLEAATVAVRRTPPLARLAARGLPDSQQTRPGAVWLRG